MTGQEILLEIVFHLSSSPISRKRKLSKFIMTNRQSQMHLHTTSQGGSSQRITYHGLVQAGSNMTQDINMMMGNWAYTVAVSVKLD